MTVTTRPDEPGAPAGEQQPRPAGRWRSVLLPVAPVRRAAVLRVWLSLFTIADTLWIVNDVIPHSRVPSDLYKPILLRRLLELPPPSPTYTQALHAVIVVTALVTAAGRLPRVAGYLMAAAYTDWVAIGFSYSKVDHDHFALALALWVLPSAGRLRLSDRSVSEAAGWPVLMIQLGCVATYFLSALAKLRFGGWDWAGGYTFHWAMVRRGTALGKATLDPTWLLQGAQWMLLGLELLTPLLLVTAVRFRRPRLLFVLGLAGFHLVTYLLLGIHFLPLVACLFAFLPVERLLDRQTWARVRIASTIRRTASSTGMPLS